MAGLVSYWNRIVEDSGVVTDILASAKGGADTDAEESVKDADTKDETQDNAETISDADTEDGDESKDDAETKADADSEVDAEANDDAETKTESDTEGNAEADADAETKTDDELPLEAGEPDAERVMARRRNFLRKPQQMPNYVDY